MDLFQHPCQCVLKIFLNEDRQLQNSDFNSNFENWRAETSLKVKRDKLVAEGFQSQ